MEFYFVVSDGDSPTQIFFTLPLAMAADKEYIDSFSEEGIYMKTWVRKLGEWVEVDWDGFVNKY